MELRFNEKTCCGIQLTHKTFEGYLLRQGGTFLGLPTKEIHLKYPHLTENTLINPKKLLRAIMK